MSYYDISIEEDQMSKILKLCRNQNRFFKKVYLQISAAAKMLKHAVHGEPKQVMGLLQGSYHQEKGAGVFYVSDVIHLPVQSSETRVDANEQTHNIMAAYSIWIDKIKAHNIVGWYHSHPSFGCWLSGIDVNTQERYQNNADPFLAIVVDPIKSLSLQKLDIGAFRVYPKGYKEEASNSRKDVPRRKANDFGYHYQRYYQIPLELVATQTGKKTLKNFEKKQWATTLSTSVFFKQLDYLTEEVADEKKDLQEFLEYKSQNFSDFKTQKQKEVNTLKKVAYYAKQRNVSLLDQVSKGLLF